MIYKKYIIQLADDSPSGDITPFVTSKNGYRWVHHCDGATAALKFNSLQKAKKFAKDNKWQEWGYCINEVTNVIGKIVYESK